jgi:hypothetical protein
MRPWYKCLAGVVVGRGAQRRGLWRVADVPDSRASKELIRERAGGMARYPVALLLAAVLVVALGCGGTSAPVVNSPAPPAPSPTATVTAALNIQHAPAYPSFPPRVNCANVRWQVLVLDETQFANGKPSGPLTWNAQAGIPLSSPPWVVAGSAPEIVITPPTGALDPGAQALVTITGAFSGGSVVRVHFSSPQAPGSYDVDLTCAA